MSSYLEDSQLEVDDVGGHGDSQGEEEEEEEEGEEGKVEGEEDLRKGAAVWALCHAAILKWGKIESVTISVGTFRPMLA